MRYSDEHKEAVRQLYRHKKSVEHKYKRDLAGYAKLSYDGKKLLDVCSYCGATNAYRHKHRTGMCVECGKLYERWNKAVRLNIQSELALLKPRLLQRRDAAVASDKFAAERSANFYKKVEQTEVLSMNNPVVTHKVCKQCGRDLPIDKFRKYTPRGTGVYVTTQGYNTICKDCESISNRTANALQRGDEETLELLRQHYRQLRSKGLEPVTAAARRLLGVDTPVATKKRRGLEELLSSVQGTSTTSNSTDAAPSDLQEHLHMLEQRSYKSIDEAWARQRELEQRLRDADLWERASDLFDEWDYEEG